ncbi:methionine--tRNA ligase [Oligosphaera ethanolica]|uniref:Methionine--tRNA ligase n=1 Tax=Oligosphaera ethanolica TaxID=760260 RepID=A0AAE3VI59_9BACT|nr:methionine--tRNA ligase [Oligosphaera ethanolica]MDQ0290723.1 methionyl-tRNA synthetase [Oligosphaera ethanolica]
MGHNSFYVTTPIYYVNDKPHIGHAYTTILADVLARYHRLMDEPTHFLTGTDEHGQKVQQAAKANNVSPLEHCNNTVVRFQELWQRLGITHDDFIRTTEPRHTQIVQAILSDLHERGLIYSASYKGWYCVPCERFYTEKDLVDGECPECHRNTEELEERSYFFKMSQYQDRLIDYIESHPEFIQPAHRRQETLGFLKKQPLGDLCISRPKARLSWGIELPFDHDYVTYVWFDALVNYISAVGYRTNNALFSQWWPASYHLIGKDILTTHTVYWPTMLMAMGVELPKTVFAHGWWLVGDTKMSKSLNNVVNPMAMIDQYGVDAFRYFLMAGMSLGQDASFTEKIFVERYNADLANDLGNLASRAIKMIERNFAGLMPPCAEIGDDERELATLCLAAAGSMAEAVKNMQLDNGLATVLATVREANRYFDKMKPWVLAKSGDLATLGRVLRHTMECLRIASGLLYPCMPEKMTILRRALGISEDAITPHMPRLSQWNVLSEGAKVALDEALFPRAEYKEDAPAAAPPAMAPTPKEKASKKGDAVPGVISIAEVGKVKLQTAEIIAAEPVANSDKLLKLQVRIDQDLRQIVSGIAKFYSPDSLIGKHVIVITNLKPAVLRGVESNGMLLAAEHQGVLRLITTDGPIPSGASVG